MRVEIGLLLEDYLCVDILVIKTLASPFLY